MQSIDYVYIVLNRSLALFVIQNLCSESIHIINHFIKIITKQLRVKVFLVWCADEGCRMKCCDGE